MTEFLLPSGDIQGKVRRSKDGRPYVRQDCPETCTAGRVPGKREGTTKRCPKCKGKGYVEKLYTRCTSFVGVLEDKTTVEKWRLRITLTGLGVDHGLLESLNRTDPDDREMLDAIAAEAFEIGEGHAQAQKGTDLHALAELVDRGEDLPRALIDRETGQERPVTLQDRADMAAWVRLLEEREVKVYEIERFVVQDSYEIGGTYDRLLGLGTPICQCGLPTIGDLKTGRIDYGAGKMAQQLAVYANSQDYDPETGARTPQEVCTHFGLIIHLPQGTGAATVHVVDLEAGWADVKLSDQVRNHRREQKLHMWPLESHPENLL